MAIDSQLIGYVRVSSDDQSVEFQHQALTGVGCYRIWTDHASGAERTRPQWTALLDQLRPGDDPVLVGELLGYGRVSTLEQHDGARPGHRPRSVGAYSEPVTPFREDGAMITSPAAADPGQEAFTPHVKACRDLLVDHVERLLGVPIIGEPSPVRAVTAADASAAGRMLAAAIDHLDQEPDTAHRGPYVLVTRQLLVEVSHLLDHLATTGGADARRIRVARRRLRTAVDHLTAVMFAQPADDPPGADQ